LLVPCRYKRTLTSVPKSRTPIPILNS
jgi:hypothetical protein